MFMHIYTYFFGQFSIHFVITVSSMSGPLDLFASEMVNGYVNSVGILYIGMLLT